MNGQPYESNTEVYLETGSTVVLQAILNPGYVFTGWPVGAGQVIAGFQDTVTMTGPINVYPVFRLARQVSLSTDPPALAVLADRTVVATPSTLEWGVGSVHSVGANSPQTDHYGRMWSFQSWSDGGGMNHAYTVASSAMPDSLTATYVPAAPVTILTVPVGLKILVDGQYNVLYPYYFVWGLGETHHLEAAAQQTDAQGRVWQFSSWSRPPRRTSSCRTMRIRTACG